MSDGGSMGRGSPSGFAIRHGREVVGNGRPGCARCGGAGRTVAAAGFLLGLGLALAAPSPVRGAPEILVDGIPHVRNGAEPSGGEEKLELREVWRSGGDDEESVLFGVITQVPEGPDGNIYLLDRQLSQVHVFSPAGEFLGTRSREGEGPGEVRGPIDMAFLEDGRLALMQGFPGKIVILDSEGNPAGSFHPAQSDPSEGGYCFMRDLRSRGGTLACAGRALHRNRSATATGSTSTPPPARRSG